MSRRTCDVCGHGITPTNPDHGFGRVMIADCLDCGDCAALDARAAETGRECPTCRRIMSRREFTEQGSCNDCYGGVAVLA